MNIHIPLQFEVHFRIHREAIFSGFISTKITTEVFRDDKKVQLAKAAI